MEFLYRFSDLILDAINSGLPGLSMFQLITTVTIVFLSLFLRGLFAKFIILKLKKIVEKTGNKIDDHLFDSLSAPLRLFPIVFIFIFISFYIEGNTQLGIYFEKINRSLATIFVFWFVHQSIYPFTILFQKLEQFLSKALTQWLIRSLKYLIIFLGAVAVLEIWGIKIGPVIAGLGLFGVAVALGAQDLFKNLISGILIILEKRFNIGDIIEIPGHAYGTVEHIGFRSTLIRQFDTTSISLPNHFFSDSAIMNYSERKYRRIKWIIGLTYNSSIEQLKTICNEISSHILKSDNFIINEEYQAFVRVEKFNDSSIDVLIQVFTNTNEWEKYLDIKQDLALDIKKIVENNNSSFAFPSSSIYIEKN